MSKSLTAYQLHNLVKAGVSKSRSSRVFGALERLGLITKTPRDTYVIPDDLLITKTDLPEIIQKVIECTH
ncbi:hypothetical protein HW132_28285 [Brasilonema sp. CT11]|nr:hypothetical protein [Brasilonema sp. CT11]